MLYIVTQEPKYKYRNVYHTAVAVIEAESAADAKRKARALDTENFSDHADFKAINASPLALGAVYLF